MLHISTMAIFARLRSSVIVPEDKYRESRKGFTDFPGQQPQLSPTCLCMNYKGEVPENGIFTKFDAPNLQAK
jgi:hypothetical protein